MRSNLDSYFASSTEKLVFLELEKDIAQKSFGEVEPGFVIPVLSKDIVNMATQGDGLSTLKIVEGILYLLGVDGQFKNNGIYLKFLDEQIEKPQALASTFAKAKYDNKNLKEALIYLRAAILIESDNPEIIYNYAHICKELFEELRDDDLKLEALKEAEDNFKQVIDLDPENYLAHYQMGFFQIAKGDLEGAENSFEKTIEFSQDPEIIKEVKELLSGVNINAKFEEAEKLIDDFKLEEALNILDELPDEMENKELEYKINYAKGFCLKAFSLFEEAIAAYERALHINNRETLLLCELGICYAYTGDFHQAAEFYLAALDLEPESVEILSNTAIIYLNLKDVEKAKGFVKRAMEISPGDEIVEATITEIRKLEESGDK